MHVFLFTKSKKNAKRLYIYTKSETLFKKQDNLRYVFIHKNPDTLRYAIFMNFLKLAFIYIQKAWHFLLCDVFIYKTPETSKKTILFALSFLYAKSLTLSVTQFLIEFLKWLEEGGHFFIKKTMHFALHFYMKKNSLSVKFLYTKSETLCVTFLYEKTIHFALRLYIYNFHV